MESRRKGEIKHTMLDVKILEKPKVDRRDRKDKISYQSTEMDVMMAQRLAEKLVLKKEKKLGSGMLWVRLTVFELV